MGCEVWLSKGVSVGVLLEGLSEGGAVGLIIDCNWCCKCISMRFFVSGISFELQLQKVINECLDV